MNNLEILVEKSREKKAIDEFVGAVYKKNGEIKFRFRKEIDLVSYKILIHQAFKQIELQFTFGNFTM